MLPITPRDSRCHLQHFEPLIEDALCKGVSESELLHGTGIDYRKVKTGDLLISPEQVERLILNALDLCPEDFGLSLGQSLNLSAFGIVGYAALSSPTTGDALYIASRYMPVVMPMLNVKLEQSGDRAWLDLSLTCRVDPRVESVLIEITLASLHAMASHVLRDRMPPVTLEITARPRQHQQQYAREKGALLVGERPGNRIVFNRDVLDEPMPLANFNTYKMSVEQCEAMLDRLPGLNRNLAAGIRQRLLYQDLPLPSQEQVAQELHMSTRTLHRFLQREGTSFREIAREVLTMQAKRLLEESDWRIGKIALELGYSDSANFSRAFRRDTGVSPSTYRRSMAIRQ
ncbi:MAG: AraC family transcriptional regulator [Pseudomonadota bacterium]